MPLLSVDILLAANTSEFGTGVLINIFLKMTYPRAASAAYRWMCIYTFTSGGSATISRLKVVCMVKMYCVGEATNRMIPSVAGASAPDDYTAQQQQRQAVLSGYREKKCRW